jgi:hypothetical protein
MIQRLKVPRGQGIPGDTDADAIIDNRVDPSIAYSSGKQRYARLLPDAMVLLFPSDQRVGPEYALALVMDLHPGTLLLQTIARTAESHDGERLPSNRFARR